MDLVKVKSANLAAIGYDERSKTLRILFLAGAMYDYEALPAKLFNQLMKSESKGEFFQEKIKEQFKFRKVNPREEGKSNGNEQATESTSSTRSGSQDR